MFNKPEPENIQNILNRIIKQFGWQEKSDFAIIINKWEDILGEKMSKISKPNKLNDGILTINVDSSVWRSEIFLHKEQIIENINKLYGRIVVKDLIIR